MRAAIYARYSSDNQSAASINDQVRICRADIDRHGGGVAGVYTDQAISGASTLRPRYQKLLEDARDGAFGLVVAEGLDPLSRDLADVATLYKHLSYLGIRLWTVAEGDISSLHVGLKGTMNELLKDLAQKTHRGLEGRIRSGMWGGGISYGYDLISRTDRGAAGQRGRGHRRRRNFEEYAAGRGIPDDRGPAQ
jgi:site-specific DNA recombinase